MIISIKATFDFSEAGNNEQAGRVFTDLAELNLFLTGLDANSADLGGAYHKTYFKDVVLVSDSGVAYDWSCRFDLQGKGVDFLKHIARYTHNMTEDYLKRFNHTDEEIAEALELREELEVHFDANYYGA